MPYHRRVRQRLRRLPAFALMVLGFALFVGGCVLATLPYDAAAVDDPSVTVECGPPPFELAVPDGDERVAASEACASSASSRFWFGLLGMAVGVGAGLAGRRIHRHQLMAAIADGRAAGPAPEVDDDLRAGAPIR